MPYPYPFGESVTVIRETVTGEDSDGNDVSEGVETTYESCAVWSADANGSGGNEYTDGRDLVVIGLAVLLPPGVTVGSADVVRARGELWQVIGQPQPLQSPLTGWNPGTPVALRRYTG